ncbi:hypothetical protein LLG96_20130 [bacterium]|nr:hypothetical protein [bacterium]
MISALLWPFKVIWGLLTFILMLTGRFIAIVIGLVFMISGLFLTIIVLTMPVGIPLIVVGFLLAIRGVF